MFKRNWPLLAALVLAACWYLWGRTKTADKGADGVDAASESNSSGAYEEGLEAEPEDMNANHPPRLNRSNELDFAHGGKLDRAGFDRLSKDTYGRLPRRDATKHGASEAVYSPEEMLEASRQLSGVKEALLKNSELFESGLGFYDNCSRDDGLKDSIRALCLSNMRILSVLLMSASPDEAQIPRQVRELADKVPVDDAWMGSYFEDIDESADEASDEDFGPPDERENADNSTPDL